MKPILSTIALALVIRSACLHAAEFTPAARNFLDQNCAECHDADRQKGNLRVDLLSLAKPDPDQLNRLVLLFDRVQTGEMPPKKADQPSLPERAAFLSELRTSLIEIEKKVAGDVGGRTTVRRLNRVEYESALRDLLALPLLRVKELLPEDGQQFGFDKVAGALDISHIQMTKYLQAADFALRQAVVKAGSRPETKTWRELAAKQDSARGAIAIHCAAPLKGRELAPGLKTHIVGNPEKDMGNTYRAATFNGEADSVAVLTGVIGAHQPEGIQIDHFRPAVSGWYRVKFSTWSLRWERIKAVPAIRSLVRNFTVFGPPYFKNAAGKWEYTALLEEKPDAGRMENVEFYGETETTQIVRASLKGEVIGFFDAPSLKPTVHEFKVWLNPGERISLHAMTLPATGARNSGSNNGVVTYEGPGVAYDWFEVEGPLIEQWPPASQQRLFGDKPPSAHPRPMLAGVPTIQPGDTVKLPVETLREAGQTAGTERLLNVNGTTTAKVNCAAAGEYEVAVTASETPAGDEAAKMWLFLDGVEMPHARFTVDAPRSSPKTYRAKFRVESAGPVTIGVQFTNDFLDEANSNPQRRDRNLFLSTIAVSAVKSAGTVVATAPAASADSHRSLLLSFASQAFRRPVAADEITPYAAIIEAQLAGGVSFEEAMFAGYKAILCAPDFLLIGLESGVPQPAKNGPAKLGDYALASRLSFFLWNSLPDATLLDLAAKKALSQPVTLKDQVERMLADPRSERFVEHFLDEWLELKKIDFTTPDPNLYPEYDPWLHDSMLAETRATFCRLLTKNLSVREVIASDTLLINQRLAELYGIRDISGADFREVKVPAGTPRGGFLTQAAILKVTANGTATSPVLRGVWIMERILGIPRLPPPPNIPAVEPDATGAVTIRQMLEKHRADTSCASCHAKMDPPGFALENFDVIGGWRDHYRLAGQPTKKRVGKDLVEDPFVEIVSDAGRRNRWKLRTGSPVDATGEVADGRKFTDVTSFRTIMLQDEDTLARNVARQLMIYATGAGVRFSDREAIEGIVEKTKATKHGLRSIVEAVVTSDLFQAK